MVSALMQERWNLGLAADCGAALSAALLLLGNQKLGRGDMAGAEHRSEQKKKKKKKKKKKTQKRPFCV
jgi:hypothetical protein